MPILTPEQQAREQIDRMLDQAGRDVQPRNKMSLRAARGVAVCEYPLTTGYADYLLFVDRRPIGVIEAKAVGNTLSGVEPQAAQYCAGLPADLKPLAWHDPLPFRYTSTGVETYFANDLDPDPRSRRVFSFHRPATLAEWARTPAGDSTPSAPLRTGPLATGLRARLRQLPPLVTKGLWIYDLRTNSHFTLKQNPLTRADLDEFVACYHPENRHDRKPTWSEDPSTSSGPEGRWRAYRYEELMARDKVNLDIFWLRDESLEETANLPEPEVLAAEMVEDLESALEQLRAIVEDLGE